MEPIVEIPVLPEFVGFAFHETVGAIPAEIYQNILVEKVALEAGREP